MCFCLFNREKNNRFKAIQVSYAVKEPETLKQEINGLKEACNALNIDSGFIITLGENGLLQDSKLTIKITEAWKFILRELPELFA